MLTQGRAVKPEWWLVCALTRQCANLRPEVAPADLGPEWVGATSVRYGSRYDLAGRVYKHNLHRRLTCPPYSLSRMMWSLLVR